MYKNIIAMLLSLFLTPAMAQNTVIDISGNNTDKDYKSYDKAFSIPAS